MKGVPQIEVTFDIDANGIVNVSAKDLGTGKEQHITITAGSSMSDEEIEKAVREAKEFEAQDKKRKEAVDTRNEAESFAFQTEKALQDAGDKLDAASKETVEADLKALKDMLESTKDQELSESQISDMKAAKEKLMNSAQALFAKMYEQTQGAQGAGAGAGQGAGPDMGQASYTEAPGSGDDNVVDGDFREV